MIRDTRALGLILSGIALSASLWTLNADVAGSPYQGIVERNVFNLRPPPTPADNTPPPVPPPRITLTGITTILGNKRALMKALEPPKPPEPAREVSYILAEGQRDGDIEVIAIDERAGSVKVNNHGTIQELSFDKDGQKLPNNPPPLIAPPGLPGAATPPPYANAVKPPTPGLRTIPPRTLRLPPMPGSAGGRAIPPLPGSQPNTPQ
jgi:hypothetical protein